MKLTKEILNPVLEAKQNPLVMGKLKHQDKIKAKEDRIQCTGINLPKFKGSKMIMNLKNKHPTLKSTKLGKIPKIILST